MIASQLTNEFMDDEARLLWWHLALWEMNYPGIASRVDELRVQLESELYELWDGTVGYKDKNGAENPKEGGRLLVQVFLPKYPFLSSRVRERPQ